MGFRQEFLEAGKMDCRRLLRLLHKHCCLCSVLTCKVSRSLLAELRGSYVLFFLCLIPRGRPRSDVCSLAMLLGCLWSDGIPTKEGAVVGLGTKNQ